MILVEFNRDGLLGVPSTFYFRTGMFVDIPLDWLILVGNEGFRADDDRRMGLLELVDSLGRPRRVSTEGISDDEVLLRVRDPMEDQSVTVDAPKGEFVIRVELEVRWRESLRQLVDELKQHWVGLRCAHVVGELENIAVDRDRSPVMETTLMNEDIQRIVVIRSLSRYQDAAKEEGVSDRYLIGG